MPRPFRFRRAVANPAPQARPPALPPEFRYMPPNLRPPMLREEAPPRPAAQDLADRLDELAQMQRHAAALNQADQRQAQVQMNLNVPKLPWDIPAAKPRRTTRALPAGRMRSIKLGDIIKAYKRKDGIQNDYFTMIDFRPVRPGDHYLDNRFNISRFDIGMANASPRIIIELIKGSKKKADEFEFEVDYQREARERPE